MQGHTTLSAPPGRLERLAHVIARHRWPVIAVWIVLTLVGGVAAGKLSTRWYQSTAIPGKPAYEGSQRALKALGAGQQPPIVVVFHAAGGDVTRSAAVRAAMARVVKANPGALTSSYFSTGNAMYASRDRHTTFLQVYPPNQTTPAYLGYRTQACSKPVRQLSISVVKPGSGG